ncbi:hypothetical protein LSAT2_013708 [Lamellibrachia satsuma]|nr:hypothetical protein LSAT2_013708 [Lamellibrachia satsuma]
MANVRGLLVLSFVCLLLCQMMSLSEACTKIKKCTSVHCGTFCCRRFTMCLSSCKCLTIAELPGQQVEYAAIDCWVSSSSDSVSRLPQTA